MAANYTEFLTENCICEPPVEVVDLVRKCWAAATAQAEAGRTTPNNASDEICACAGIETSNMHPKSIIKSWRYCPYCGRKLSHIA